MAVVVEEREGVYLGYRRDEQVDRLRAPVLAAPGEGRLCPSGGSFGAGVRVEVRKPAEVPRKLRVVAAAPGGVQKLELDRCAEDELVGLDHGGPPLGDELAPIPGARVGEKRRH
jgi:hypothetical protein